MNRETRGWSATVRPGSVPKLIVTGEVSTHPYAQAFLKEGSANGDEAILHLTLTVLADTPRNELKQWTGVSFEKRLIPRHYAQVQVSGAGDPVLIAVNQVATSRH